MRSERSQITLTREDDRWVATDEDTKVASQGPTREGALENLDQSVELTKAIMRAGTPAPEPYAPCSKSRRNGEPVVVGAGDELEGSDPRVPLKTLISSSSEGYSPR